MSKFVTNDSRLRQKLRRFPVVLTENIRTAMTQSGYELSGQIAANAPKKTGVLAENVRFLVSGDGLSVRVGYGETTHNEAGELTGSFFKREWKKAGWRAVFIEYGTRYIAARPFVRPAYRAMLPAILKRIDAAVNATLERASSGDF